MLGQILSQFCIMPELNAVYSELFSNKGAQFYAKKTAEFKDEMSFIENFFKEHNTALPITIREENGENYAFS